MRILFLLLTDQFITNAFRFAKNLKDDNTRWTIRVHLDGVFFSPEDVLNLITIIIISVIMIIIIDFNRSSGEKKTPSKCTLMIGLKN